MATPVKAQFGGHEFGAKEFAEDDSARLAVSQSFSQVTTSDLRAFEFQSDQSISQVVTGDLRVVDFRSSQVIAQSLSADISIGNVFFVDQGISQVITGNIVEIPLAADIIISQSFVATITIRPFAQIPAKATGFDTGIIRESFPFNIIQTWNDAAAQFKARSISITDANSLPSSLAVQWKVNDITQYTVQEDGLIAFGPHIPKARIHGADSSILGASSSANIDADLGLNEANIWVDEPGSLFKMKVKDSSGVVKSGQLTLT